MVVMSDLDDLSANSARRIQVRLLPGRLDDKAFLDAFDARCEHLNRVDHEFLRTCLLVGYSFLNGGLPELKNQAKTHDKLDLSYNESNNTETNTVQPTISVDCAILGGRG
jgi:hypothetical protein